MSVVWKTYRIAPDEGAWEPASYNIQAEDGQQYGRWRRVLRKHPHGLTVISRYKAPPGKAWKIVGKASELGRRSLHYGRGLLRRTGPHFSGSWHVHV
jgi:hypothetical protein